jgi:hypothetical protein
LKQNIYTIDYQTINGVIKQNGTNGKSGKHGTYGIEGKRGTHGKWDETGHLTLKKEENECKANKSNLFDYRVPCPKGI